MQLSCTGISSCCWTKRSHPSAQSVAFRLKLAWTGQIATVFSTAYSISVSLLQHNTLLFNRIALNIKLNLNGFFLCEILSYYFTNLRNLSNQNKQKPHNPTKIPLLALKAFLRFFFPSCSFLLHHSFCFLFCIVWITVMENNLGKQ